MERSAPPAPARVLLAEDDRSVRDALVMALEVEGYEVRATNDGEQALTAFDAFDPDVVLLDVMMPTVDGLTACRRLRSRGIATPILMLTARDQVADRVSGLDAGADDYVVKPFSLDELLARLRALLRRHQPEAGATELAVADLHLDPLRRAVRRGDRGHAERDPPLQAHLAGPSPPDAAGRTTYPTPRTVWTRRGSPSASVLRRR